MYLSCSVQTTLSTRIALDMSLRLLLLHMSLLLQVGNSQLIADIDVFPPPEPIVVGCLEQTVAICVVTAAEPAAINWRTGDLPYSAEERKIRHENGIVTTRSELRMIPKSGLNGIEVTCILQQDKRSDIQTERTLTIQNIHFAPEMVDIHELRSGDDSLQFSCHSEANPPAEYTWKRGDQVIASGMSTVILPREAESGLYKCEAKNYLGVNGGNLQIMRIVNKEKQSDSTMEVSLAWIIILGAIIFFFSRYFFG
ncbi:nectin 1a-like [Ranitomeya variabilis]|uniref:nectin 1a-like n=1 Tax=Ranitomeya variabilis TaxID=490064 RepID=UPI00405606F5